MAKKKSYHYHLICGTLMLANGDAISSVSLNAIIHTDTAVLNAHNLGQAQQALQMNFHQRMEGDPDLAQMQIVDVVIANINHLGFMTPEKFREKPKGMELQEREAGAPEQPAAVAEIDPMFSPSDDAKTD